MMIQKNCNFKFMIHNCQRGMTYVELIVVLSIFSVMTSITLFNYKKFQESVDIKILANDIALKIVEAQKSAINGKLPVLRVGNYLDSSWKPSYGVSFYSTVDDNKRFTYLVDYPNILDICATDCGDIFNITKGNSITDLSVIGVGCPSIITNLYVSFKRPDSSAIITSTPALACNISYAQITVSSVSGTKAMVKVYPSGRIQIN